MNFNMIDIVGRGIRKIFNQQWERRFPMPDYEIDAAKKEVAVRLYGNAINEKYTKLLKEIRIFPLRIACCWMLYRKVIN